MHTHTHTHAHTCVHMMELYRKTTDLLSLGKDLWTSYGRVIFNYFNACVLFHYMYFPQFNKSPLYAHLSHFHFFLKKISKYFCDPQTDTKLLAGTTPFS